MPQGLRQRLTTNAVLPAVIAVLALAAGAAWLQAYVVRQSARDAARIAANALAHRIVPADSDPLNLSGGPPVGGALIEARVLDAGGAVRAQANAPPDPPPDTVTYLVRKLGAAMLGPGALNAETAVPGAPALRVSVRLRPAPWLQRAGLGVAVAAAAALAAIMLALALGLGLSARTVSRLRAASRQVARMARGETVELRPPRRRDELALLETDLNRLATGVRRTQERLDSEIDDATAALQQSLEELEAKNAELDLARRRALDAGTAKSDLLGMLSHELRTPLNAILGYARLLHNDPLTEFQRQSLGTITGAARTLTRLLDGMLNLARAESGLTEVERRPFDLISLVDDTLTLFAPRAYAKRLDLIADCGGRRGLPVLGDPIRVQQVLSNLIGNALKYTPRGRVSVHLDMRSLGSNRLLMRLHVRDTGPGIAPANRSRIFERFQRLEESSSLPGEGLGLAISKKLVDAMNGHIEIADAPGGGSEFRVSLPLARASASRRDTPEPAVRKALVWDADPVCRTALANRLRAAGIEPLVARGRSQLAAALKEQSGDCDTLILGLSPGEAVPVHAATSKRLLVLACSLPAAGPPGVAVAPKCLGQARLEAMLGEREAGERSGTTVRLSPRLWRMLCEDTPADLARLAEALRAGRTGEARAATHRIRGTAAFVHLRASERAARVLEEALSHDQPEMRVTWDRLARLGRTLLADLRRTAPPEAQQLLVGWRILVVEDNRLNGELLARHLEAYGASVTHALSADEARNAEGPWHAILVDVQLGPFDGIQTGEHLRGRFPSAVLIAQSADTQPLTRRRARAAGFTDYLTKPLDLESLPERLRMLRRGESPASARHSA